MTSRHPDRAMTGHTGYVDSSVTRRKEHEGMSPRVEIHVRGPVRIDEAQRLGLTASVAPADTVLRGTLRDRPALHGVLDALHSHGLELVSVRRLPGAS
jgi:hypothetical protein